MIYSPFLHLLQRGSLSSQKVLNWGGGGGCRGRGAHEELPNEISVQALTHGAPPALLTWVPVGLCRASFWKSKVMARWTLRMLRPYAWHPGSQVLWKGHPRPGPCNTKPLSPEDAFWSHMKWVKTFVEHTCCARHWPSSRCQHLLPPQPLYSILRKRNIEVNWPESRTLYVSWLHRITQGALKNADVWVLPLEVLGWLVWGIAWASRISKAPSLL